MPPAVKALMEKVKVEADEALLSHYPQAWPARLTVVDGGGKRDKLVIDVPGDPKRALGESGTREKSIRILGPLLGDAAAAELFAASLAVTGAEDQAAPLLGRIAQASAA